MNGLDLPQYPHKVSKKNNQLYIFDQIRKKDIILTPEEWVRQQIICWLVEQGYPKSLMSVESGLKYHQRQKRTDIVVYDRQAQPFLIVECKAMHIALSQDTLDQVSVYNHTLQAPYILVTNSLQYQAFEVNHAPKKIIALEKLPVYEEV